jgi:hypothetical protein
VTLRPSKPHRRGELLNALPLAAAVSVAWTARALVGHPESIIVPFVGLGLAIVFGAAAYARLGSA